MRVAHTIWGTENATLIWRTTHISSDHFANTVVTVIVNAIKHAE